MAKKSKIQRLGISFGAEEVQLVQTEINSNRFKVTAAANISGIVNFNYGLMTESGGAKAMGAEIKQALTDNKITARELFLSIDANLGVVVKIPYNKKLPEKELSAHINWEFRQYIDDDVDNYNFDSYKLVQAPSMKKPEMIIVGARKNVVSFFKEACKAAGVNLQAVNLDLIASLNSFEANYKFHPKEKIAIVEVGENKLVFSILEGNFFIGYHSMLLDESVQDNFSETVISLISHNLKTLFSDYDLSKKENSFDRVFFYRTTRKYAMNDLIQSVNDNSFSVFNPFEKVKLDPIVRDQLGDNGDNSEFVEALGLTVQ